MSRDYEQELFKLFDIDGFKLTKETVFEYLNREGFDINKPIFPNLENTDYDSRRFIVCDAVISSSYEVINTLVENGAELDCYENLEGFNPISIAAAYNRLDVAKLFIDHGANLLTRDVFGYTPLVRSVLNNDWYVTQLLLENYDNSEESKLDISCALFKAVGSNKYNIAKLLLEKGANPNIKYGSPKKSSISLALNKNREYEISIKLIDLLLDHGAEIIPSEYKDSENFVHRIIQQKQMEKEIKVSSAQKLTIKRAMSNRSKIRGLKI